MEIREQKRLLRRQLRQKNAALDPAYCRQADGVIIDRIKRLATYKQAKVIFSYVATAQEIDTKPLISQMIAEGKVVAVPRCITAGVMEGRRIVSLSDLYSGAYGLMEPAPAAPLIDPQSIDMVLVPCVGGNELGQRLGHGGGFYDAYLASCPAVRVLLCRTASMVQSIPMEPHDAVMDMVVSERGIAYPKAGRLREGR